MFSKMIVVFVVLMAAKTIASPAIGRMRYRGRSGTRTTTSTHAPETTTVVQASPAASNDYDQPAPPPSPVRTTKPPRTTVLATLSADTNETVANNTEIERVAVVQLNTTVTPIKAKTKPPAAAPNSDYDAPATTEAPTTQPPTTEPPLTQPSRPNRRQTRPPKTTEQPATEQPTTTEKTTIKTSSTVATTPFNNY